MNGLQEFGIQLIQLIQGLSPTLDSVMEAFTFMGKIEFYMIFITFLYWIIDANLGFRVLMVLLSTDIIGMGLKHLFCQPRPYWIGDVKHFGVEMSYGIPSTHASDSLSVWAYVSYQMKKQWLWVISILIILLISFSRLYLGVHFPHDLVFGWLIGLVILFLFIFYGKKVSDGLKSKSTAYQIRIGFVISVLFILIGLLVGSITKASPDPADWSKFSTEARSLTFYFTLGGAFFGATTGYALMISKIKFKTNGSIPQYIGRYLVGIVGVLICMYGLDFVFGVFAPDESVVGFILRYIRYGATTFWAMFGAPWLFIKINLADTA